ncbi:MAG: biotin--[acetyl-CoA-carboxylase] ligase [Candidatus Brocadiales bacterium]
MKETVLDCLHDPVGKWLAFSELILRTSLTETQLHQELMRIQQAGYAIDYHPRRGYRLMAIPDRLVPDEIQRGLNTHVIGREILTYEEVDSTMSAAEGLAEKGARDGTTVFAEEQRRGRGRVGHHWYCPKRKGILMTTILRPHIKMDRICLLAGMMAVAVAEAVRDFVNLPALIKWPNDVIVNNKKVCGILVEATTPRGKEPYFLAGIGLNANLTKRELPKDVIYPATSLLIEKGSRIERIGLSRALLRQLDKWYTLLKDGDYKGIRNRWVELFPMIGHKVRIQERNKEHVGKIIGLSAQGGLVMELDGGLRKTFRGEYLAIKETIS